ncbi:MAG: NADH-quinone oxidoreductase subunit J [Phycisphaerae bacterium]|nr:NADH-quinone oxidoreductase subunit J [Phycisphaerae bacterium]
MNTPAWLEPLMFYLFAGVALLSALGIVLCGNIVRSALCLLGTLGGVAGLYFLMFANLLAVIQLIVYAGGTLVLIIFGVMLTSKSPWVRFAARRGEIVASCAVVAALFVSLCKILTDVDWSAGATGSAQVVPVRDIGAVLLQDYLVPFEAASVLLLAVLIGAAYLARPQPAERTSAP